MMNTTTDDRKAGENAVRLDDAHQNALRWMVEKFDNADIPHLLIGGAAARIYGASRELRDLDFFVPGGMLDELVPYINPYVTYGPERERGDLWRLTYLKVRYLNVLVEITDAETASYRDVDAGVWRAPDVDFDDASVLHVGDVEVCVMPQAQLISYKTGIDRPEDRADIR